jgi:hypothetical protein
MMNRRLPRGFTRDSCPTVVASLFKPLPQQVDEVTTAAAPRVEHAHPARDAPAVQLIE